MKQLLFFLIIGILIVSCEIQPNTTNTHQEIISHPETVPLEYANYMKSCMPKMIIEKANEMREEDILNGVKCPPRDFECEQIQEHADMLRLYVECECWKIAPKNIKTLKKPYC